MAEHPCKHENDITDLIRSVKQIKPWVIGVLGTFIGVMLFSVITLVRLETQRVEDRKDIDFLQKDYTPMFIIEAITGSNDELIKIINVLPSTTKDDPRYLEAIKERNDFVRNMIVKQSKSTTRSASASGGTGASK